MDQSLTDRLARFYDELPFNYAENPEVQAEQVITNPLTAYPDVVHLFETGKAATVLDLGCGVGWFCNAAAHHYGVRATGIDISRVAIARAEEVACLLQLGMRAVYRIGDLFSFNPGQRADLVAAVGVIHHTAAPLAAIRALASFVSPAGHVFLGLYHRYGRPPFLEMFADASASPPELGRLERFACLANHLSDRRQLYSWFRDQIGHPHESLHTFEEVQGWLDELGFDVLSTSINGFKSFASKEDIVALEKTLGYLSYRRNQIEGIYYPGFFTILARRRHRVRWRPAQLDFGR